MAAERSAGSIQRGDRTDCLQRGYSLSYAAHYTKSSCSTLSSNMVSQALSFPTATNVTLKVKTKESIPGFLSVQIHPREKMMHASLGLKRENVKHSSGYYHLLRLGRRSTSPPTAL